MNQPDNTAPSTLLVVLAFATVYIVWGSTYFFIQMALEGFPPLLLGAVRFLVAGLIMIVWGFASGQKVLDFKVMKQAAVTGVLLLFVGNGAVIWVEQFMPSAMVAIIISSSPIWFIVLDKPKWKENFNSKATLAGMIIGFGGVLLLFIEKLNGLMHTVGGSKEIVGMCMLIFGAMCWSGGSLYSKYNPVHSSAIVSTSWQMLAAGLAFTPLAFLHGEVFTFNIHAVSNNAWLSLVYLVFFGSIAGFSAYVWLLKVKPAAQVSTYAYVNPVVAVLLGVLFANEHISAIQIIGLATILGSVFLINLVRYSKARSNAVKEEVPYAVSE